MKYYSVLKRNEVLIHAATWRNPETSWEEERLGSYYLMSRKFQLDNEKVLEMNSGNGFGHL